MAITKEVLEELLKDCQGPDGLVKQLDKALIERMKQVELTDQLGYKKANTEKNRLATAGMEKHQRHCGDQGPMEIEVPRDRNGEIETKVVPKHQREWRGFDDKIISMYG